MAAQFRPVQANSGCATGLSFVIVFAELTIRTALLATHLAGLAALLLLLLLLAGLSLALLLLLLPGLVLLPRLLLLLLLLLFLLLQLAFLIAEFAILHLNILLAACFAGTRKGNGPGTKAVPDYATRCSPRA
ncbi:hypothetical protein [Sphingomonas sp. C3-2]|uniref:hypothetical protein n=1 Tax=Sphingomonas sp. C3-2 TaxID=3062169 RepID=UPI00294AF52C|nr:hypothetical protein [Sphingomonas sp. C3-2]WOK35925.1 hypothetical protein QYC26_13065 [Sphingomonas sp. C3-2]